MKGEKALVMKPIDTQREREASFIYGQSLPEKPEVLAKFKETSVKGSQFKQPLLEFSGACAGCGETPYAKLATQLFGDRMYIANATGCSSIWGGSAPSTPYTVNKEGHGPAWANSLFEDNAEYGLGMTLAQNAIRGRLAQLTEELIAVDYCAEPLKAAAKKWLETMQDSTANGPAAKEFIKELALTSPAPRMKRIGSRTARNVIATPAPRRAKSSRIRTTSRRNPCGFSAATAGPMISVTADLTM